MTRGDLLHVETFDSSVEPGKLEAFLLDEALPYWRSRGFSVKVYVTQYALGSAQFWLCTELDDMASFERWPEMAEGQLRGKELMDRLLRMTVNHRASVAKNLEAAEHGR